MKLNLSSLKSNEIDSSKIELPKFDVEKVRNNTLDSPKWIHFGGGNIFRAFIANCQQHLLNEGLEDTGIVVVETYDEEVVEKGYKPFDFLNLLAILNQDGDFDIKVIASIAEAIVVSDELTRLVAMFENPQLQMASYTITEKGYSLRDSEGEFLGYISKELNSKPEEAKHVMVLTCYLLYRRYLKGELPITLVSMDNCSDNGDKIKAAMLDIAAAWKNKGYVEDGFLGYLEDTTKVGYPISMIDKITPRPAEVIMNHLMDLGFEDMDIIETTKHSYIAPFVNAETTEYLVIEDVFTNGRPELEKAGVIFTDRETVHKVETMKVTTCLNPLHTTLATAGCLLGYTSIADEMKDEGLVHLITKIGYDEGLKVVVNPGILDPKEFIDNVVQVRLPNSYIPDTPQRIATDTSMKVGIRYGETIKSYIKSDYLDVMNLKGIQMAIALWLRYLVGVDDQGEKFNKSPDPKAEALEEMMKDINFGSSVDGELNQLLSNVEIFGLDLVDIGMAEPVIDLFNQMNKAPGAIRKTVDSIM